MKAKIGTRYQTKRTQLQTVIPLSTPFVLYVDPSSICNLSCEFCPCQRAHKNLWTEAKRNSFTVMDFELYKKIIDDCSGFPDKIKTLRLCKEGEPLVNKRLPEMIEYAAKSGRFETIDFTTNGVLLEPELNRKLVSAGLSRINISVESLTSEGYKKISNVDIDFDKYVENIRDLYEHKGDLHIFIKIVGDGLDKESQQKFYDIFGDICDEIGIEHITNVWPGFVNTDEMVNVYHGEGFKKKLVCPRIFYLMTINADGTAPFCFVDWNYTTLIGNVKTQSVVDIWNCKQFQDVRLAHLRGERFQLDMCKDCQEIEAAAVDDIDDYKDELLKKVLDKL